MDKQLSDLLTKLSKPYWMPTDPRATVRNLTPDHIGQLNIVWVMLGRQPITQGFFDQNLSKWELAGQVSNEVIDSGSVRDYACLFSEYEFHKFILHHREVFSKYLPISTWNRHFKVKA